MHLMVLTVACNECVLIVTITFFKNMILKTEPKLCTYQDFF